MEKKKKSALKSTLKKALKNKIVLITGGTGSILDKDRLDMACDGVDIIIHSAAIKNIEISEFNPIETKDVNINETVNLIKMAIKQKPEMKKWYDKIT